jgi:hypothetical protein
MREMIVGSWRTTLLAVSILLALLMFTQGKISTTEFLAVLGFFNVAGYLLAKDARTAEHRNLADDLADTRAVLTDGRRRRPSRREQWIGELAYRLLLVFIVVVLALCFYPLLRDALADRTTPRTYSPGTGSSYGSPYGSPMYSPGYSPAAQPSQPVPGGSAPPAHDDEPPHPATGPGAGLAH